MSRKRWSALGILESEGIELVLGDDGKIRPTKRITDRDIDGFIRANRDVIARELQEEKRHGK